MRDFLDVLSSSAPAPGGGAAAALAGALGAALVEMTANLTVGKPKLAEVESEARRILASAGEHRRFFEDGVDADAHAFDGVSAAYRLPKDTDAERQARSAAIQRALAGAAGVPLEVADRAAGLLEVAEAAAPVLNAAVISDVVVGAMLASAALEGAALNVEVNLAALKDPATREPLAKRLASARDRAAGRLERVVSIARSRAP